MLTTTIEVEVNRYESPERDVYGSIPTRQVRDTITLPLSAYYFSSAVVNDSRKMEESRILKGFSPVRTLSDRVRLGDHVPMLSLESQTTPLLHSVWTCQVGSGPRSMLSTQAR